MKFVVADTMTLEVEGFPAALAERVAGYLDYFAAADGESSPAEARLVIARPPEPATELQTLLVDEGLRVRGDSRSLRFELPGIVGWIRPSRGEGGVWFEECSDRVCDRFVSLALASMLIELGPAAGLFGIHGAAVASAGRGILLPGPSGAGKSTLYRACGHAGLDLLSDDLVWIRPTASEPIGYTLYPFPRGRYAQEAPRPTIRSAPLAAIACPTIVDRADTRLVPIDAAETLDALLAESGFLARGATAGARFKLLTRLAGDRPGYRLEAGSRQGDAPALLVDLIDLADPNAKSLAARH